MLETDRTLIESVVAVVKVESANDSLHVSSPLIRKITGISLLYSSLAPVSTQVTLAIYS